MSHLAVFTSNIKCVCVRLAVGRRSFKCVVACRSRLDFNCSFIITNVLPILTVKYVRKSVNIWWSQGVQYKVWQFFGPPCIVVVFSLFFAFGMHPIENNARLRTYNMAAERAICADCWILRTQTITGRNADKLTHWRADAVTSNEAAPCYCCKSICGCSWLFVTALDLRAGAALLWPQCCIPRYASWL